MTKIKILFGVFIAGALTACGGADPSQASSPATKKTTEAVETKTSAPVEVAELTSEEALLKRGRIVWFKCRSCHELSVDGPHKVGPNLHAIMGAEAGVKEGFIFSDAMKTSGIIWTEEALDEFIKKPSDYIKGTKMAFVGIKKETDRQAVIAYIQENAKPTK